MTTLDDVKAFIEANVTAVLGRADWQPQLAYGVSFALPLLIVLLLVMVAVGRRHGA